MEDVIVANCRDELTHEQRAAIQKIMCVREYTSNPLMYNIVDVLILDDNPSDAEDRAFSMMVQIRNLSVANGKVDFIIPPRDGNVAFRLYGQLDGFVMPEPLPIDIP